jgi:hypothetical protein
MIIPSGLAPDEVKGAVLDRVETLARARPFADPAAFDAVLKQLLVLNRPRGLTSLSALVIDEGSMSVSVAAAASPPQTRRIPWSALFAPADKIDMSTFAEQGQGTVAAISVNGRAHGATSDSQGPEPPNHAENLLVNGSDWTSAIELAKAHDPAQGTFTIAIAINRAPCQGCSAELADKLSAVKPLCPGVTFVLAPTGTYEPGRPEEAGEVARDREHYRERAQALGRPFEEMWDEVKLAQYLDEKRATRGVDLRRLAQAGWDIHQLQVGPKLKPFGTILAEYAHALAVQLGRA